MAKLILFILFTLSSLSIASAADKGIQNIGILQVLFIVILSASVTALLRKQNSFVDTLKNWLAGICAGIVIYLYLGTTSATDSTKYLVVILVSAFVSSIYPKAEQFVNKKLEKWK